MITKLLALKKFVVVFVLVCSAYSSITPPKNVILLIGDGMGRVQESVAEMYLGRRLSWSDAPFQTQVKTKSTESVTDSAASATAMATGVTVDNDVISRFLPGNGSAIFTSLEYYQQLQNKKTAIVTNTEILHATPAAFASHQRDRSEYSEIWEDYLISKANILMGGGREEVTLSDAEKVGYKVATSKTEMLQFQPSDEFVMGVFGNDHLPYEYDKSEVYSNADYPHLHEMVIKSLELLDESNENGFFLVVECGRIDHAGHANNIARLIYECIECDLTFQYIKEYTLAHAEDTLTIVTADHETGGLKINRDNGIGKVADVSWEGRSHTDANVNIYAYGEWAHWLNEKEIDNEEVFRLTFYGNGNAEEIDDLHFNEEYLGNSACSGGISLVLMFCSMIFVVIVSSM